MPITSSASRNIKKLTSKWFDKTTFKQLTYRKLSKSGRNKQGRIIIWTKSSLKRRLLLPKINYSYRDQYIGIIGTFKLLPFQNKLTALVFFSSGGITYKQSTDKFKQVFSFVYFPTKYTKMRSLLPDPLLFTLCYAKPLTKVSLVELFPGSGIQYIRSSGTSALLIKSDQKKHVAVLQLPSGVKKSFSLYSLASLGSVSLKIKKLTSNTKSGYYRTFGLKSKVRGVAMNPVDHPHGGRAKSIKYPRTPWGKTTKFK